MKFFDRFLRRSEPQSERQESSVEPSAVSHQPSQALPPLASSQPPPTPTPYLEAKTASGEPLYISLAKSPLTIGRDESSDFVIDESLPGFETVSAKHARLEEWKGRWVVVDLQSDGGVFVNGRRTGENALKDGFKLNLGMVEFIFHANAGESQEPSA